MRLARDEEIPVLQAIEQAARTRYRGLAELDFVAAAAPIAVERLRQGHLLVADGPDGPIGFVLSQPMDGMLYLANISVVPDASGRGTGVALMRAAIEHGSTLGVPALMLTTFKAPRWNGPWFRRQGFTPMPAERIGDGLRQVLERQARSVDPTTREVVWRPLAAAS